MKVYIVRHGETENNKKGVWTGWNDIPLTKKGEEDAARLGKLLKDIPFDAVFASDLQRACKTAEIAIPNCDYKTNEKLRHKVLTSLRTAEDRKQFEESMNEQMNTMNQMYKSSQTSITTMFDDDSEEATNYAANQNNTTNMFNNNINS